MEDDDETSVLRAQIAQRINRVPKLNPKALRLFVDGSELSPCEEAWVCLYQGTGALFHKTEDTLRLRPWLRRLIAGLLPNKVNLEDSYSVP